MMKPKHWTAACAIFMAVSLFAQTCPYEVEGFEDPAWSNKGSSVTLASGTWVTNKNCQDTTASFQGKYSLYFSAKAGLVSPELKQGLGAIVYYAKATNRQVYVETSVNRVDWEIVESYKETGDWVKHAVAVYDEQVRYVRIRTTSNNNFAIDNLLFTTMDGCTGGGEQVVTDLQLPYFVNTFENPSFYPSSKEDAATEKTYQVEGQGEWKYYKAYKNSNTSYITDGSNYALRMMKSVDSYVITPVFEQGLVTISFNEGRTDRDITIYASKDGGQTWTLLKFLEETEKENTLTFFEKDINRLKFVNESGSDIDIDNICITAFPKGTPAEVRTGDAAQVTASSAVVGGRLLNTGDKPVIEWGVCWAVGREPSIRDLCVKAKTEDYILPLKMLTASSSIYYRAYAISLAGVAYGETKSFRTSEATVPVLKTCVPWEDAIWTDEQNVYVRIAAEILDNGGLGLTERGVCYAMSPEPTVEEALLRSYSTEDSYQVGVALLPQTRYYFRAYARNEMGLAYGNEQVFTTSAILKPDYPHRTFYVSPLGQDAIADGSAEHPFFDLQLAVDKAEAGDTIYMLAGTYAYTKRINITAVGQKNSGMIALFAKDGRAVLDFSSMPVADNNQGIRLTGSYWHFYGMDICGAGDNGLLIERNKPSGGNYSDIAARTEEGHDNLIENCRFYRNRDTGLQMKNLAENNRVVNCDSYFNADPDHGDADGFAVKLSHGTGNYFFGCRAWNNSDDGWDGFIKSEGGFPDDITTTFDECWAFRNGYLEDGTKGTGNGNGFKLGSDEGRNNNILNRCLAFENMSKGFDQNHNTGFMILNNCTGYSSKDTESSSHYTYRLDESVAAGKEIRLTNCVAISDGISDRKKSAYAPYSVLGDMITCDMNTLPNDFRSVATEGMDAQRDEWGNLPQTDFMRIAEGNDKLIDKGSVVSFHSEESRWSQGIVYKGAAPDLGCFETDENAGPLAVRIMETPAKRLSACVTRGGLLLLNVREASVDEVFTWTLYDVEGRLLGQGKMYGTTCIHLPDVQGTLLLNVQSQHYTESLKLMCSK